MINKINSYLAKSFLKNFLIVILGFSAMFFLINILDIFERIKDSEVSTILIFVLAVLKIPQSLTSIISSIVLISAILTFYQLSIRSELTIIRSCGYSIWKISMPVVFVAFILAVKSGQYDDDYTPSVRMLFDDELRKTKTELKTDKKQN